MKYCGVCGNKLNQDGRCPVCNPAAPENKKSKKTLWVILGVIAVLALVAGAVIIGYHFGSEDSEPAQETTVPDYIQAAREKTPVVIAAGHELTGAQIAYWLRDTYAEEQAYLGTLVDTTVPLHEQDCPKEGFDTWYDYMLDLALKKAASTYMTCDEAMAQGYTLSDEGKQVVDDNCEPVEEYAQLYGFLDADAFLSEFYGKGCTMESYKDYLMVCMLAQEYATDKYSELKYEQAAIDAYYDEHADEIDMVSYRVFELLAETTTDKNGNEIITEEDFSHAEIAAIAMAEEARGNEKKFLELAKANTPDEFRDSYDADTQTSAPDTAINDLPESIRDWFSHDGRIVGDVNIEENVDGTGFYVYYYLGPVDMSVKLPSVRHILIQPEKDEEGNISDEAWIAAEEQANALLEQYLVGERTDAAFAALADANTSDTGSVGNGGLYENIKPDQMVPAFDAWCFDAARQPGDTGIVETTYGYHVMYFKSLSDRSYLDITITERMSAEDHAMWQEEIEKNAEYTIISEEDLPKI